MKSGAGDPQRRTFGARPRFERAVGVDDTVLEHRGLERDSAAVGAAAHADPLGIDDALIDQQTGQVLDIANFVTNVIETNPS